MVLATLRMNFRVDWNARIVFTKAQDVIRLDDFEAYLCALVKEKVFAYSQLIDSREARLRISPKDVHRLVSKTRELRTLHGHARTSFVTRHPADFGMMRMYETLIEKHDPGFAVFYEMGRAEEWIRP